MSFLISKKNLRFCGLIVSDSAHTSLSTVRLRLSPGVAKTKCIPNFLFLQHRHSEVTRFDFGCRLQVAFLHNKVSEAGNETGQQMSFGHLSPGLWLGDVMGCVCTCQSQGQLPASEWKKASAVLFSPAEGAVRREAELLFRELHYFKNLDFGYSLVSHILLSKKEKHVSQSGDW